MPSKPIFDKCNNQWGIQQLRTWFQRQLKALRVAVKTEEQAAHLPQASNKKKTLDKPQKCQLIRVFGDKYWVSSGASAKFDWLLAKGLQLDNSKKISVGLCTKVLNQFYCQATPEIQAETIAARDEQYAQAMAKYELAVAASKLNTEKAGEAGRRRYVINLWF